MSETLNQFVVVIPEWNGDKPYKTESVIPVEEVDKIRTAVLREIADQRAQGRFDNPVGIIDGFNIGVEVDGKMQHIPFVREIEKLELEDSTTGKISEGGSEREENIRKHEDGHGIFNTLLGNFDKEGKKDAFISDIILSLERSKKWKTLAFGILKQWDLVSLGLPQNEITERLRLQLKGVEISQLGGFFTQVLGVFDDSMLNRLKTGIVNEIYANACGSDNKKILRQYEIAEKITRNDLPEELNV